MTRKRTTENDLLGAPSAPTPARRKTTARARTRRAAPPAETIAAPVVEAAAVVVLEPSFEEIARLAYTYWEARGYQGGSAEEDWLRAEQELRTRAAAAVA